MAWKEISDYVGVLAGAVDIWLFSGGAFWPLLGPDPRPLSSSFILLHPSSTPSPQITNRRLTYNSKYFPNIPHTYLLTYLPTYPPTTYLPSSSSSICHQLIINQITWKWPILLKYSSASPRLLRSTSYPFPIASTSYKISRTFSLNMFNPPSTPKSRFPSPPMH